MALVAGQLGLALVGLVWGVELGPSAPPRLGWLSAGLLVVGLPASYCWRSQCYKRAWRGHQVAPAGYVAGNLGVFLLLAAVAVLGLLVGASEPAAAPAWGAALLAFVLTLMNVPTGRPLDPQPPGVGARPVQEVHRGR